MFDCVRSVFAACEGCARLIDRMSRVDEALHRSRNRPREAAIANVSTAEQGQAMGDIRCWWRHRLAGRQTPSRIAASLAASATAGATWVSKTDGMM